MVTSEKVDKILPALFEIKKGLGAVTKSSDNPFFKSKYADLNAFLDVVEPALEAKDMMLTQAVVNTPTGDYVESKIWHVPTGQWVASTMAVLMEKNDMQKAGSAVTYARRYTLQAMLSIKAVDDDGNAASNKESSYSAPKVKASKSESTPAPAKAAKSGGFSKPAPKQENKVTTNTQPTAGGW